MLYPPIRYVEAIQIEHEGQPMVLIRDPEGLATEMLAVPFPIFLVMSLLNGHRNTQEIQQLLAEAVGSSFCTNEDLDRIVGELDELYLLENERTAGRRSKMEREFAELATRPAVHAGGAYPAQAADCTQMFDGFFEGLGANGRGKRPRGLVVPHIDLRIGGKCLAEGLAKLDPQRPPQLYIILGVAHQPAKNLFTLTDKSFETPLGLVQTDLRAAGRLRALYGAQRLDGEYAHRNEHSVEFQAVALKYLHRNGPDFKILPILCGSMHEELSLEKLSPAQKPVVKEFIEALRRLIDEYEGDVCVIASVDMSHVGIKFGDQQGIDEARAKKVRKADEAMLELIAAIDPEGFFDHFRPDANERNVDAVTAVYVMLHALGQGRGQRIKYEQWHEEETDSMVTYASVAIY